MTERDKQLAQEWLLQPGNNFCALPYIHIAIEGNGDISPCCIADPIKTADGSTLNIAGGTINDAINHPARQEMINQFDNNVQYKNCHQCWKNNTEYSARVKHSVGFHGLSKTLEAMNGNRDRTLTWLEIKPGNRCNLRCRICGVHDSSSWASDHMKFIHPGEPYKGSATQKYMKSCNWIDEDKVWDDVQGLENVDCIHLMGGEPFMIPEHMEFLQKFSAMYDTSKVNLWYNTNGTIKIPDEYLDMYSRMKNVHIGLSIDDYGPRFEYQRKNAVWNDTKQVLDNMFYLDTAYRNFTVFLDPTVSIFNVLYLSDIVEEMNVRGYKFNHTLLHFVSAAFSNDNIRSLSLAQKEKVRTHLLSSKHANHKLITNTIDFMDSIDLWTVEIEERRLHKIKTLDVIRNERFDEIFPEMNEILGVYG